MCMVRCLACTTHTTCALCAHAVSRSVPRVRLPTSYSDPPARAVRRGPLARNAMLRGIRAPCTLPTPCAPLCSASLGSSPLLRRVHQGMRARQNTEHRSFHVRRGERTRPFHCKLHASPSLPPAAVSRGNRATATTSPSSARPRFCSPTIATAPHQDTHMTSTHPKRARVHTHTCWLCQGAWRDGNAT